MHATARFREEQREPGYFGLIGLLFGLVLGAIVLYLLAGPPHFPAELPSSQMVMLTLRSSSVPLEALAYVLTTAAWAVWLWIVASLTLRLIVVLADAASHGAAWVGSLRAISNWVTLPVVRRVVDGALIAVVVIHLASRPAPSATAASLAPPTAALLILPRDGAEPVPLSQESQQDERQRTVDYTVQSGDTLWAISERFYDTGHEFPRLVVANAGRRMSDGRYFTRAGVIHPGWVLLIPMPSRAVQEVDGQTCYVVEEGDTLRGIAARLLGDEAHWPAIFELNRGTARLDNNRVLTNADLIWPALRLRLPPSTVEVVGKPAAPPESVASPPEKALVAEPAPTATPRAEAPVAVAQPTAIPTPPPAVAIKPEPASADGTVSPLVYGAAGVAAAVAGGAALLARRRVRRSLSEPPIPTEPPPPPSDDFAEAEFARTLTHRLLGGGLEPVAVVAEQALCFLAKHGMSTVSIVVARQGRNAITLTLDAGLHEQPRVLDLAGEFAARLGGKGLAHVTPDHDVMLQLSSLKLVGLVTPSTNGHVASTCLLPLGVLPNRETFYANWRELGHLLIAGLPGGGADVILTSVISALGARYRPDELQLWTITGHHALPAQLQLLPHQCHFIDSSDGARVSEALQHVRAELARRMQDAKDDGGRERPSGPKGPELVLVIGELGEVEDDGSTLELIGTHGPAHGVHLLAATTNAVALGEDLLALFMTRLVLQTLDDGESIQLLGQPDAADLGAGDLLIRIDGRAPVWARGFRVSAEHLDELVRLMREAYPDGRPAAGSAAIDLNVPEAEAPMAAGGDQVLLADGRASTGAHDGHPLNARAEPTVCVLLETASHEEPGLAGGSMASVVGETSIDDVPDQAAALPADRQGLNGDHGTVVPGPAEAAELGEWSPLAAVEVDERANGHEVESALPDLVMMAGPHDAEEEAPVDGSLVQVRCFGAFAVRSGDREITPTLEDRISFKAFELLAFLAAHPDGAVSKDKVFAALWPNSDAERAGNRVRTEMVRLRALLARQVPGLPVDVVRSERDGICRLDTKLIWSDVHQFIALCRAVPKLPPERAKDALKQAHALYRGDLLPGRGARVYEWVDEHGETGVSLRAAYREEYKRATLRLARLYCREGQPVLAVPLYQGLLKAEPTLEDVVRELYRCYRQLEDLSSLVREDRHMRQALREAYYDPEDPEDNPDCYQPEPETIDLFNTIRADLQAKAVTRARDSRHKGAAAG